MCLLKKTMEIEKAENYKKWSYTSTPGLFNPPGIEEYPNLLIRKIYTNEYITSQIGLLIGKDGNYFINLTQKYELLYIWYTNNTIYLYGENDEYLMKAVRHLIARIKYMNYMRYNKKNL